MRIFLISWTSFDTFRNDRFITYKDLDLSTLDSDFCNTESGYFSLMSSLCYLEYVIPIVYYGTKTFRKFPVGYLII